MAALDSSSERLRLGPLAGRLTGTGIVIGTGMVLLSVGLVLVDSGLDWSRFLRSWLAAFVFVLSLSLGGLFFVLIHHATRAGWSTVVRRFAEGIAGNLMWVWLLLLPIAVLMLLGHGDLLYHWADPQLVDPESAHYDPIIAGKQPFLSPAFWIITSAIFFGVWALLSRFLLKQSVAQDASGDVNITHRLQQWAPLGAVFYAVAQSYGIILWVMSLEPHWFSTMYPVYFFAASACGFFAVLILSVFMAQRWGRVTDEISLEHYQDMGKLLFAFGIVFWAYIAFSQFMLIWYANIPEETNWYVARLLGGWTGVTWLLLIGHFVLPFLLLVTKHTKRIKPVLAIIALWMLALHYIDIYWLVMPEVPAAAIAEANTLAELRSIVAAEGNDLGFHPHLLDLTLLIGLSSFFVAGTARILRSCALVPVRDPRIQESLAFENM